MPRGRPDSDRKCIPFDGCVPVACTGCPTADAAGNVYLTGHGVTVFDRNGVQIEHIDVPQDWTANVTFDGAEGALLFITASTAIYGIRMRVRSPVACRRASLCGETIAAAHRR